MARKIAPMGVTAMLVILVIVVAFVPMIVRALLGSGVAGFENAPPASIPASAQKVMPDITVVPDVNTNYLCRSPNNSGVPCPEGQFCDGTKQACVNKTVPATGSIVGYFS